MSVEYDSVELVGDEAATRIAYAAALAALTAAFAYTAIPYPLSAAPVTLQVLGVFLAGIFLGPVWGAGAMALYVVVGALGVPVFSMGGAGVGFLRGPTGGYALSFPLAAAAVGLAVHRGTELRDPADVGLGWYGLGVTAGTLVVYAIGAVWMGFVLELSLAEAVVAGAIVFLPAEALKAAAAIVAARSGRVRPP